MHVRVFLINVSNIWFLGSLLGFLFIGAALMSFVDLFNDMERFVDNKYSRFKFVLRVKRGLMDTSEPGGLYKD